MLTVFQNFPYSSPIPLAFFFIIPPFFSVLLFLSFSLSPLIYASGSQRGVPFLYFFPFPTNNDNQAWVMTSISSLGCSVGYHGNRSNRTFFMSGSQPVKNVARRCLCCFFFWRSRTYFRGEKKASGKVGEISIGHGQRKRRKMWFEGRIFLPFGSGDLDIF